MTRKENDEYTIFGIDYWIEFDPVYYCKAGTTEQYFHRINISMDYQKSFGEGTMPADDRDQSNKRPAVVNLCKGGGSSHLSLIRHATPCERNMISGPRNNRSRFFSFFFPRITLESELVFSRWNLKITLLELEKSFRVLHLYV